MLNLVTGGAGFLGSHLVDALIAQGDDVIIADNLCTGSLSNVEEALRGSRATFVYLDVAQSVTEIRKPISDAARTVRIDRIFHLASPASADAYGALSWATMHVNGLGTMSLIELALENDARFIYASTSEIYGDALVHPQPESYFGNVNPIGPRACYDEGKRFGEAAVSVAVSRRGLSARIVRFFNCYGPRMAKEHDRLIAALADAISAGDSLPIHGDGFQTRSMTYVDDAIRLLLLVANTEQDVLEPVNIGSDEERTVLDIAETFARIAGVPFLPKHLATCPEVPGRRLPDLSRARAMGYTPRTTLDEGLSKTFVWLRDSAAAYA